MSKSEKQRMAPGDTSAAVDHEFNDADASTAHQSFVGLRDATNQDLQAFIDYYVRWSGHFSNASKFSRGSAVLSGVLAALAASPALGETLPLTLSSTPLAITAVILAGGVLTLDWAFGFTRKYTNWISLAYELGVEKAKFNIAFSKMYMEGDQSALDEAKFNKAKILAQETVKEFKIRRQQETAEWANNVQTVLASLRKSNTQQLTQLTTIYEEAKKDAESVPQHALTIEVGKGSERNNTELTCLVCEAGSNNGSSMKVLAGGNFGRFFKEGKYTLKLRAADQEIASLPVTLDQDKTVSL